jgi:hypothetical protein
MLRKKSLVAVFALAIGGGLAACTSMSSTSDTTKFAAYGASTTYPSNIPGDTAPSIGVEVQPDSKTLRVLNFGKETIGSADVWVNGAYVHHIDGVAPSSYQKLDLNEFFDHSGDDFTASNATVQTVQISAGGKLWTLLGPIVQ